jgi:hypothetical protein
MFPEVELMRAEKERRRDWHGVAGIWKRHWKGIVTGVLVAVLFFDALENWLGNRGITETVVAWAENMAEGENATAGETETKSEENVSKIADFNTEENPVIVIGSNSGLYKEAGENTTGDVSGPITGNPTDETGYYYTLDDTTYEATAHIVGGNISVETLTIPAYIQVATRTRQGRVISWTEGDIYKVTAVEGTEGAVNTSVTEISLPSTLTTIGDNAFTGMTALEEIQVPD